MFGLASISSLALVVKILIGIHVHLVLLRKFFCERTNSGSCRNTLTFQRKSKCMQKGMKFQAFLHDRIH